MLRLLKMLFLGHCHEWVEDEREILVRRSDKGKVGRVSFCHCKTCGVRKSFRMMI